MDFLNKAKQQLSSNSTGTTGNNAGAGADRTGNTGNATGGAAAGGQEDYGDKAFDFVSKKSGHTFDRNTSEKITDGARGAFEKVTGKQVDPKYSN